MRPTRKNIVGLFMYIAICSSLIKMAYTPPRSADRTAKRSTSAGDPLLGVQPFQERWQEASEEQEPEPAWITFLLGEVGESPVWWTDFWAGVGTIILVLLAIGLVFALGAGGVWLWFHQRLALLGVPAIPLVALLGHFVRDLFFNDNNHRH